MNNNLLKMVEALRERLYVVDGYNYYDEPLIDITNGDVPCDAATVKERLIQVRKLVNGGHPDFEFKKLIPRHMMEVQHLIQQGLEDCKRILYPGWKPLLERV
jgi:hypothetical protein